KLISRLTTVADVVPQKVGRYDRQPQLSSSFALTARKSSGDGKRCLRTGLHGRQKPDLHHGRRARASTSHRPLPESAPSPPPDPCSAHPTAASPPRPSPR